jgi:hypothetical protein
VHFKRYPRAISITFPVGCLTVYNLEEFANISNIHMSLYMSYDIIITGKACDVLITVINMYIRLDAIVVSVRYKLSLRVPPLV